MVLPGLLLQAPNKLPACSRIQVLIVFHPVLGGDSETRGLQTFLYCYKIPGIDLAGACAAFDSLACTVAVERQLTRSGQWEGTIGLQQHRTLCTKAAQSGVVFFFVIIHLHAFIPPRRSWRR